MTPEALTTYIVGCLRNAADIHVTEAERLLAEHDAHRRTQVLAEQRPEDCETLAEAADAYRWLRPVIVDTMVDSDRWDGDESEEFHLGRYVQWLAAGRAEARTEVLREAGGLADELIAAVQRTDPEAFARVGSFRAYSDRLHEIADSGTPAPAGESTQPDFFQPGHTYTRPSCGRAATFQVTHVSTAPDGSSVTAFGWHQIEGYDIWQAYSSEDFENAWTEVPRG